MKDRILTRYCSIARRVQALLDAPVNALARERAPEDVRNLLADGVARLGAYVAAMPGARGAPPRAGMDRLARTVDERVTPRRPTSRR